MHVKSSSLLFVMNLRWHRVRLTQVRTTR